MLDMAATFLVEPWESLNRAAEVPVGQPTPAAAGPPSGPFMADLAALLAACSAVNAAGLL